MKTGERQHEDHEVESDEKITVTHERGSEESLTETIVTAVRSVSQRDTDHLEPLYSAVDPEALAALFQPISSGSGREDGCIVFTYLDCSVAVHGSGLVEIARREVTTHRADD